MGSPLSPLLSNIFMDSLENKIQKLSLSNNLIYWFRYVDDILILWKGTSRQLQQFHLKLNDLDKNIKFTLEIENNKSINFLDLTITRSQNKHIFKIYHKPTHTDITINKSSTHPGTHKLAAYRSLIYRLVSIPMKKTDFEIELDRIKTIAINNGFKSHTVDKLLRNNRKDLLLKSISRKIFSNRTVQNIYIYGTTHL